MGKEGLNGNEIKTLLSQLEKASNSNANDKIKSILKQFDAELKPTEKLLRETKVGIAVNKLRSHNDKEISDLVKRMISKWREEVSQQKNSKKAAPSASRPDDKKSSSGSSENGKSKDESPGTFNSHGKPRSARNDGVSTAVTGDKTRDSCVEALYGALATDSDKAPSLILSPAKAIENVVWNQNNRATDTPYKNKIRSLVANLRDKKNPGLRARVVVGDISPEKLCNMSPQEMAPKELREEIEQLEKQNLFNAQGASEKRAVTDRFTCGKCKQKKVSYYQLQTRSADEPLTTFCTCENCGNRWKFS